MFRSDAAAAAHHAGARVHPLAGPGQIVRGRCILADLVQTVIGGAHLAVAGFEGVGVHAQAHLVAGVAQGLVGHTHGRFHHFRHAAVEEHGLGPQGRHGAHGVGHPFTGAQHGLFMWLRIFQGEGCPEGLAILGQLRSPEGSFGHAALCFGQPDVHVR